MLPCSTYSWRGQLISALWNHHNQTLITGAKICICCKSVFAAELCTTKVWKTNNSLSVASCEDRSSCSVSHRLVSTLTPQLRLLTPSMDCFWLIVPSIGRTAMTHRALGTVFTFILLNCIKQGNFKCVLLSRVMWHHLVWNAFWFTSVSNRLSVKLWFYLSASQRTVCNIYFEM